MKVVTAPEKYNPSKNDICVFLAGGITDCPDWQSIVIEELDKQGFSDMVVIFNPRRKEFPIDDPNVAKEQIEWEFNAIERANVFSMYFCDSSSDQPICMYELGRNLVRMEEKYPDVFEDLVYVSVEDGYKRKDDVLIQAGLTGYIYTETSDNRDDLIKSHANRIAEGIDIYYDYLLEEMKDD